MVVQAKPKNVKGWSALIHNLFDTSQYSEAAKQVKNAMLKAGAKPIFLFYESAVKIAQGNVKEGVIMLEKALEKSPRLLKHFLKLYPSSIKYPTVVELIIKHKRRRLL